MGKLDITKLVRFGVSAMIVLGLFLLLSGFGLGTWIVAACAGGTLALDIFKEIHDSKKGYGVDALDIIADVLGVAVGTGLSLWINSLIG